MKQANTSLRLACGTGAEGIVHPDGTIDVAGFRMHTEHCALCSAYLDALRTWMAEFDPQPPQVRRHIEREYFSQTEVATRLGVSARTIRRWSDRGAFPGYPLWDGRRRLYRWADIETFMRKAMTDDD